MQVALINPELIFLCYRSKCIHVGQNRQWSFQQGNIQYYFQCFQIIRHMYVYIFQHIILISAFIQLYMFDISYKSKLPYPLNKERIYRMHSFISLKRTQPRVSIRGTAHLRTCSLLSRLRWYQINLHSFLTETNLFMTTLHNTVLYQRPIGFVKMLV